jgi:hypothetical protein
MEGDTRTRRCTAIGPLVAGIVAGLAEMEPVLSFVSNGSRREEEGDQRRCAKEAKSYAEQERHALTREKLSQAEELTSCLQSKVDNATQGLADCAVSSWGVAVCRTLSESSLTVRRPFRSSTVSFTPSAQASTPCPLKRWLKSLREVSEPWPVTREVNAASSKRVDTLTQRLVRRLAR